MAAHGHLGPTDDNGAPRNDGLDPRWSSDWRFLEGLHPDAEAYLYGVASALWDQGAREHAAGKPNPYWRDDPHPSLAVPPLQDAPPALP